MIAEVDLDGKKVEDVVDGLDGRQRGRWKAWIGQ